MKHGHIKSRLDECKKFDEECKYRAIADRMMKEICRATQVPLEIFNRRSTPIKSKKIFFVSTPNCKDTWLSNAFEKADDKTKAFFDTTLGVPWEPKKKYRLRTDKVII